jgi:hypothetical protein
MLLQEIEILSIFFLNFLENQTLMVGVSTQYRKEHTMVRLLTAQYLW